MIFLFTFPPENIIIICVSPIFHLLLRNKFFWTQFNPRCHRRPIICVEYKILSSSKKDKTRPRMFRLPELCKHFNIFLA